LQEERNLFNVKVRNSRAISLLVPPFLYFPSQYRPARLALFLNVAVSGLAVNGPVEHRQNQARRCRLGDNGKAISGLLNRGTVRDGTSAHSLAQARPKTISRACELEGTKGQPNGTPRRKVPTRGTDLKPKIDNSSRPIESVSSSGVEEAHLSASQPYPTFTGEEAIVLRALAAGKSDGQACSDLRMPLKSFRRLLRDLCEKTGTADHLALLTWVLQQMKSCDRRAEERHERYARPKIPRAG
jgi:hypothetical protein